MKIRTKIYICVSLAALIAGCILMGSAWSGRRIARLEAAVDSAKAEAERSERSAISKEKESMAYREKIEYLENQLSEIQTIARKQDEELRILNVNSRDARGDVERARRTRTVAANANELCTKLAELGHPCR